MPKRPKIEKEETLEKKLWRAADKLRKNIADFVIANPPFNDSDCFSVHSSRLVLN